MTSHKKNWFLLIIICSLSFPQIVSAQYNMLTPQEKADGWELLFNGDNLKGWHSYLEKRPGKAWKVLNGTIMLDKNNNSQYSDYADLVSNEEFENFDLKVEWKIEPCANSGLMFYVHESPQNKETYQTGPEMQITDLYCSPDSRIYLHRAGDLYDLIPVDTERVTPGGKWNQYEIIADQGHLQLFQNGHKVIDTQLWTDHWQKLVADSKFAQWPGFGTYKKGHISFQGTENGKLWFRNIKIRKL